MTSQFGLNDASRIIDIIDGRIQKNTRSGAKVEYTWGTVYSTDGYTANVYLNGETDPAYVSQGFRLPYDMGLAIGDSVKVGIDYGTGERWVEERYLPTRSPSVSPKYARNLLPNGGFRHGYDGWTLYQNGDTTASLVEWANDPTWTLRDGDSISTHGSTMSIHSTASSTYEPYMQSVSVPVQAGLKYSLSALAGTHRVTGVRATLWFYDKDGTFLNGVNSTTLANDDALGGGSWLAGWRRLEIDGWTAPSSATSVVVCMVLTTPYVSGTDCWFFIDQVMLTQTDFAVSYQPYEDVSVYRNSQGQLGTDEFMVFNSRNTLGVGNGILGVKGSYSGHTTDYIALIYEDSTAGGVLQFGLGDSSGSRDVNLFRGAANVLKTDDIMHAVGGLRVTSPTSNDGQNWEALRIIMPNNGYTGIAIYAAPGDTQPVFKWAGYGGMDFGPGGSTAMDTQLYRSAAAVLYTPGEISANTLKARANGVQNIFVGDDASIGDVNVAHTLGIKSQTDANYGGIQLGADTNLFRESANWLRTNDSLYVDGVVRWISETWTAVSYANSWTDYGSTYAPVSYRKDAQGYVHLRGLMKSGTLGSAAFTLPAGYRPGYAIIESGRSTVANSATYTVAEQNRNMGRVDINTDGTVVPHSTLCNNGYVTLEGITFLAEG